MNIGSLLLYISLILTIWVMITPVLKLTLYKKIFKLWNRKIGIEIEFKKRYDTFINSIAKLGSILLFITVTSALLLLYYYFITSNMNVKYVWQYSSSLAPLEYKLAGVLAGEAGSLLFWLWCIVLSLFVEEIIDLRKPKNTVLMGVTRVIMMIICAIFLYFLIENDLFAETPKRWLELVPDGQGLNHLLQTPLMIVHPPIVFIAYGFIVICMASAMAYLICNDKDWVKLSMPWSRLAWLFLTLGIGVGGLWAYTVLGWGGYWAWDPVETSSFLPWILLTAFLHAQLMYKRKRDYKFAAPALGIYSFVLVIFATFSTRAGGLWQSVHAFEGAGVSASAFDRLIEVLSDSNIILGYFLLMIGISILGAILLIWAVIKRGEPEEEGHSQSEKGFLEEMINDRSLMFFTLILFTITTIVTLLLLVLSMNGTDRAQFDSKVGFFAMIGIMVLVVCLIWKYLGRKATLLSLVITGAVSLILAFLFIDDWIVASTMPFLLLASGASLLKIVKSINTKSLRASINGIAPHLVHLGVVFILIGFVGSNYLVTEEEIDLLIDGQAENVGNYDFKMIGDKYHPYESEFAKVEISQNGKVIGTVEPGKVLIYKYLFSLKSDYKQYLGDWRVHSNIRFAFSENNWLLSEYAVLFQIDSKTWLIEDSIGDYYRLYKIEDTGTRLEIYTDPELRSEIAVKGTLFEDIYLIYNTSTIAGNRITRVNLIIKTLPLMNVLWIGMWLMAGGIVLRLVVDISRPKRKAEGRVRKRARMRAEKEKSTDYYEDLIEKELEEME